MNKSYIDLFKCPNSGENLTLEILKESEDQVIEGSLKSSNYSYPITNGIPRFVEDEGYSDNFGWQWNKWARIQFEDENIGRPMAGHTEDMFKKITELDSNQLHGKVILDIGCGPGRFVDIAKSMGATVIAIDYSSAIDAAKENFKGDDSNVLFVQGDALNHPFKNDVFDYAYSIGVLHHTPDPRKGVHEAMRTLKVNGEFAVCVYGKNSYYDFPSVQFWRKFHKLLWPLFGHYPPLIYSNIIGRFNHYLRKISKRLSQLSRIFFPSVTLLDVRWSVLDTFDSVTPSYQSTHDLYEVQEWFVEKGYSDVRIAEWDNLIAKKQK